MRVGKVAGHKDHVGLQLVQQGLDDVDIGLRARKFLDAAGLIERQIQEVGMGLVVKTERTDGALRLRTADSGLDVQQFARLRFARDLRGHELLHLVDTVAKAQFAGGVHMLDDHVVVDSNVTGGLIGDMDVVALMRQANECTAHRNDVVVGVRRENEHGLRERLRCHRTG